MNFVEKLVYDLVKENPAVKLTLRNFYQQIMDMLPLDRKSRIWRGAKEFDNCFVGFHDIDPISKGGKYIIALEEPDEISMPLKMQSTDCLVFDLKSGEIIFRFPTCAFNYHKGSRQQWIDEKNFIVNSYDNAMQCLRSEIVNVVTGSNRIIPSPVDSVSPDGLFATSFDYYRLEYAMPGYGYPYSSKKEMENVPSDSGLCLIDLESGKTKLVLSIEDVVTALDDVKLHEYFHIFTHTKFSPCGRYVALLHRWVETDIKKRTTQIIIYDLKSDRYSIPETTGMVSHYDWTPDSTILMYASIDMIDGHYLIWGDDFSNFKRVAQKVLNSDGHQSVSPCGNYAVIDTYPDRARMQKLYKVDLNNFDCDLIAKFYHPRKYQSKDVFNHWSCDLHPRWSNNGNCISVDTVYRGKRSVVLINIGLEEISCVE